MSELTLRKLHNRDVTPEIRGTEFKEDDAVWKGGEDGGVGGSGPAPTQMGGMGPQGGYVAK